jgi:DNA-binding NarL/FixJ family response regulator
MAPKRLRAVLADDHSIVRAGLCALVRELGVDVVAEASNGREALQMTAETRPDFVVMDIQMPELNGLEATAALVRDCPGVPVMLLSVHGGREYVEGAVRAGAAAYLLKDSEQIELELAIRAITRGETYFSPPIARQARDMAAGRLDASAPAAELTPRQRQILRLIAEGHRTNDIAVKLSLSPKTVATHRTALMARLGIHDVASLVRYAVKTGLVHVES